MDKTEENIVTNDADAVTNDNTKNTEVIANDTVNLSVPIVCGNKTISSVKIGASACQVGSLRGIRVTDLFNSDVDVIATFLERVTEPRLSRTELMSMCPEDFFKLYEVGVSFLLPSSAKKKQEAVDV
ncbi:phage tail assembly protein [Escherichia coli]|nr:phage tail assembly protein [Escherichia coli]EJO7656067.1 phage tail assembly protein [Escherichia coli]